MYIYCYVCMGILIENIMYTTHGVRCFSLSFSLYKLANPIFMSDDLDLGQTILHSTYSL